MQSDKEANKTSRRQFLERSAAAAGVSAALLSGASAKEKAKPVAKATTRVLGANDRINVAFIGCGMQFHALVGRGFVGRKAKKNDFEYAAVCDVWEPRVKHAQQQVKAEKTYRDFHDIIARHRRLRTALTHLAKPGER